MKTGKKTPHSPEKVTPAQLANFLGIESTRGRDARLGAKFNTSRQAVHNWITRGEVPKSVLTQLADDHDISVKELITWITRRIAPASRAPIPSAHVVPLWRHRLLPSDLQARIDRLNEFQLGRVQQAIRTTLREIESEESGGSASDESPS